MLAPKPTSSVVRASAAHVAASLALSVAAFQALAQDVRLLSERNLPVHALSSINHLSEGDAGELRLCGVGGGAWVSVLSPQGEQKFSAVVDVVKDGPTERCWTVLSHDSTGTVIAGHTNTHTLVKGDWGQEGLPPGAARYRATPSAALLAWLAPDGSTRAKKILGELKPYAQNAFYRGLRVRDGYILVGAAAKEWPAFTSRKVAAAAAVQVVKTDFKGNVVWKHDIAEDAGAVLNVNNQVYVSALLSLSDGSLVFAIDVHRLESRYESGERRLYGLNSFKQDKPGALMVRMSPNGEELRRRWWPGITHLALRQGELIALDNPLKEDRTAIVTDRVRVRTFDRELDVTSSRMIALSPDYFSIQGIASANGRIFAIGNHVDGASNRGRPALVEVTNKGLRVVARYEEGSWGQLIASRGGTELVTVRLNTTAWGSSGLDRIIYLARFRVEQ